MKNILILLFIVTVGGAIAAGDHSRSSKSTTRSTEYSDGDMQAEEDTTNYDNNTRKERSRMQKDTVKEKTYNNGVKRKTRTTTETVNP